MALHFEKVSVIAIPTKEIVAHQCKPVKESALQYRAYEQGIDLFKSIVNKHPHSIFIELKNLQLDHFLPYDTHWSETGNKYFINFLEGEKSLRF